MASQETVLTSSEGLSAESIDSEVTGAEPQSPWPFLGRWVRYKKMIGDSYIFQCLSCLPKITHLKVNKSTKANLKSHFNRIHPDMTEQINEACMANVGTGGRSRKRYGQPADGGSTSKKHRLMSITETFGIMTQGNPVLQFTVDKKIIRFVVDNMLSLQIVDSQSFRDMVHALNPSTEIPSRKMLGGKILKTYEEMKEILTSKLEQVKWVGTTADCWSANKKRYLGMTVHWLDPDTRDRKIAVLTCKRIMGSHTQVMENILSQFGIEDKVTMQVIELFVSKSLSVISLMKTTTDNAANFQKVFVQFDSDVDDHQGEKTRAPESEVEPSNAPDLEELIADPPEGQGSLELEFVAFDDMEKSSEDGIIKLPRQHMCAAHILNLVASADIEESHMPRALKKAYRSAMAKAQALWNKASTVFADSLCKAINIQLIVPTNTRWYSFYDSLVILNKVLEENKDQLLRFMNQQWKLTAFSQKDIDFLSEYVKVMAPVASALDHIQEEKQCYLGCLIPILIVTKKKLVKLMATGNLLFCEPLVNILLAAIERRFAAFFEDEECLLATAFHPRFRLKWMGAFDFECDKRMVKRSEVESLMEKKVEEFLQRTDLEARNNSNSSSEDMETEDYYASICDEEDDTGGLHRSTKSKAAQIVKVWLQSRGTESLADPAFNNEKVLINLFLRYNTAMPSSTAVEPLTSLSEDVIGAKRSSLSDENFNMFMFMKGNMSMLKF
ncbi:uncharacterized protein LOC123511056 [Portunus trituberculatus]|uniref:uncharacterized protein LOC123511056 n=1 Tax=Portunus trituberculatus TaxID=210409 RepID=UPI001E1D1222|nr:uncharacterized protein LOC123511056 [Portunus trituberculatus]